MRLAITFWGDRCYREGYPECKCGCREDGCFTRVLSVHFFGKVGCKDKYKENVKNIYKRGSFSALRGGSQLCSGGIQDLDLMSSHCEWMRGTAGLVGLKQTRG